MDVKNKIATDMIEMPIYENVREIIIKPQGYLPTAIPELHKYILIGKEKLKAHKALIQALDKVGDAHAAKGAALSDTQDLAEALLDAEAKLGELLAAIEPKTIPDGTGRGTFGGREKTIPDGITKKESHQAQTIVRHPEIVERIKERAREEERIPTAHEVFREIKITAGKWTGDQESFTPPEYVEAARKVMGSIDLDPASCEVAQITVKAKRYYTKENNGLDKHWKGNIFLNPPYSHPEVKQFIDKLLSELKPGQ
jgi:hypothetical protein